MRKFLVILCSMALIAGTVAPTMPTQAAEVTDEYAFDGDIIDNAWQEHFTTEAPTEEPTTAAPQEFAIIAQPADVEAEPDETAVFKVGATGTGLTYQWQYTTNGTTWKNLSGSAAKKDSFSILVKKSYNGYQYRCIVKDSSGKTLTSEGGKIIIVARTPLAIIEQPEDVIITETQIATFHVEVQGVGLTFQWQYFVPSTGEWKKLAGAAAKTDTFSMEVNRAYFDGAKYRCFIKDCVGNTAVTSIAYVYAKRDFELVTGPKDMGAVANGTATFEVNASGTGLTYQWQYATKSGSTWYDLKGDAARSPAYTVTALSSLNGYKYRCVVTDYYGETKTTEYGKLVICDGITINEQPQNTTVTVGEDMVFTVKAVGPGLTYQWQYATKSGSTWNNLKAASATTDTLVVTSIASFNGYKYRCVLTDSLGNVVETNYATVTVK